MTAGDERDLEQWLRSALHHRAADAPNRPDLAEVGRRAAGRRRRRIGGAAAAVATAVTVVVAVTVPAIGSRRPAVATLGPAPAVPSFVNGAMRGSLVLPLTGTVEPGGLPIARSVPLRHAGPAGSGQGTAAGESSLHLAAPASHSNSLGSVAAGAAAADQTIDVPPGAGETLDPLATRTSPDDVMVSTFLVPKGAAGTSPLDNRSAVSVPSSARRGRRSPTTLPVSSCNPTGELLIEASDTKAVGTFTEPLYIGFTTPLVAVEIGELGVLEASPATWVEAEVGPQAASVDVRFADGGTDAAVPAGGVAVLAIQGDAATTIGTSGRASLQVLAKNGRVLAVYSLAVAASTPRPAPPPSVLPAPGAHQPAAPAKAAAEITQALATALSCAEPPVVQAAGVADGGSYEEVGGAGSVGMVPGTSVVVEKVVFTSPASAVVRFVLAWAGGRSNPSAVAQVTLADGKWLVSLGSVSPGLEVSPPKGDGDVHVAPGGPILVERGPDGTAVAVYRAVQNRAGGCIVTCTATPPDAACVPTGGIVEEITTSGAVGVLASPLFARYDTPFVGVGLAIVGQDEGAPATVVTTEVAAGVSSVDVVANGQHQTLTPVDGTADAVLPGAPAKSLSAPGTALEALGAEGTVLARVPIKVDASGPAPASSLPTNLPATGSEPSDPMAATAAIAQVFTTVFGCASSPFVRAENIQDNGMFTNPLEQLYVGGYAALVESVYATIDAVAFVSSTLADVSYTLAFHDDPTLSFREIGTAVLEDGSWRVSYATLCAAVALGGVRCES